MFDNVVRNIAERKCFFAYLLPSEKGGMKTRLDSGKIAFTREAVPQGFYVVRIKEERERFAFLQIVASATELEAWWDKERANLEARKDAFLRRYFPYVQAVEEKLKALMPPVYTAGYYVCRCGGTLKEHLWGHHQCDGCGEKFHCEVKVYECEYETDDESKRSYTETVRIWTPYEPQWVPEQFNASYEALHKKEFYIKFPVIYVPRFEPNTLWAENALKVEEKIREIEQISVPDAETVESLSIEELLSLYR